MDVEAQEISTALIAAEQRIGELLLAIPKATGNQYTSANSTQVEKAKSAVISSMGYSKDEASDYQRMAQNPEAVQAAIDKAGLFFNGRRYQRHKSADAGRLVQLRKMKSKVASRAPVDGSGAELVRGSPETRRDPARRPGLNREHVI